jgi:ADP-heptose:LPS heptosyltransferase
MGGPDPAPRRTLAIHPGALGDVLLAVPALRALRRARVHAARHGVVLAAQSHIGELLHALGEVDDHVRFEALGLDALFAGDVPRDGFAIVRGAERAVCWFGSQHAAFVARLRAAVPNVVVASSVAPDRLVWQHLLATLETDVQPDRGFVRVPPALVDAGSAALAKAGWDGVTPLLVVHPGGSAPAKRWPARGFAEVLRAVPERVAVAVHEGPLDAEPVRALLDDLDARALHVDNPPLPLLAGLLVHATGYLGNDSGVSHVAAAVGTPSVVLFTSALTRWTPWAPAVTLPVVSTASPAVADVSLVKEALAQMLGRSTGRAS